MKKGVVLLVVALVVSIAAYCFYYAFATAPVTRMLKKPEGSLEWLRSEYQLTDAQYARIRHLHAEYAPKCVQMCEKIRQANARLEAVIGQNRALTPAVEAAMEESAQVRQECTLATLAHVYAVSAEMSPHEGQRFVEAMRSMMIEPGLVKHALASSGER
jgi:hypothetical protein